MEDYYKNYYGSNDDNTWQQYDPAADRWTEVRTSRWRPDLRSPDWNDMIKWWIGDDDDNGGVQDDQNRRGQVDEYPILIRLTSSDQDRY